MRRLGSSDNTVAAVDNTTSSLGPAVPKPIPPAEADTSGPEETLGQGRAGVQARATLKGGLRPTSESSANLLASASTKMREAQGNDVVESAGKLYAIRAIAGKGKGLVATTRIAKGTRLLSEVPIFRVPRDNNDIKDLERIVADEVKCLGDDQQHAFFDLTNVYGSAHSEAFGIARTNVLPLGSSARSGGLFLEASRINHSCKHNSQNTWNENIGQLTIHSLRDIEAGQEITISYLINTPDYAERQRFLKEKFKFECKCELCSLFSATSSTQA
ncbi:SET domain-containing protein [Lepidopterella palustris CBS 459.81]|uniref:SET domain-containing protein n=1 Tax=Lepidopterella palustris CBS 459.81 TaxID=1314670 RepID=A0A8E2EGM5_9PEZI|nr:SET domain-containing protein [Lepidopterella palustris CBS 459.81]